MAGSPEVADVSRRYGEAYREQHGASLSTAQRRAMSAIELCRTAALGGHVERCDSCGHQRISYNSCRSRNCPKCQSLARAKWLEDRQAELLDTQYFHVVFTVPPEIAVIASQNKAAVYDILFRAAAETLRTIAADPAHLGAEIGFLAILHTWGQNLLHHPHLHCLVPGGGLSPDGTRWVACRPGFFLPVRVLSRLFRRLFLAYLEKAFLSGKLAFFSSLQQLRDRAAFRRHLVPVRAAKCRVGEDVAIPTPHRSGRAGFPHPVLHGRVSLAVGVEDAIRHSPVEKRTGVMMSPPSSSPVRLSVVVSWTGSRSPESPPVFPGNGSPPVAPPFPRAGPGEPSSPRSAAL